MMDDDRTTAKLLLLEKKIKDAITYSVSIAIHTDIGFS